MGRNMANINKEPKKQHISLTEQILKQGSPLEQTVNQILLQMESLPESTKNSDMDDVISYLNSKKEYGVVINLEQELTKKGIKVNPDNIAYALINLELYLQAEDCLLAALESNPNNASAYVQLADVNIFQGKYQKGMEMLEKAHKLNPKDFNTCFKLGLTAVYVEDLNKAVESFKKAIDLSPSNVEPYLALSMVYLKLGEIEDSDKYRDIANKINSKAAENFPNEIKTAEDSVNRTLH